MIRERVNAGLARARAKGVQLGQTGDEAQAVINATDVTIGT
jgi:hypothetical protein